MHVHLVQRQRVHEPSHSHSEIGVQGLPVLFEYDRIEHLIRALSEVIEYRSQRQPQELETSSFDENA